MSIKPYLKTFFLLLIAVSPSIGHSQNEWDLEKCINYAITNNITIKQQELSAASTENSLKTYQWSQAPSINGSASSAMSFGRSLDNTNYTYVEKTAYSGNLGVGAQVTLFSGMNIRNNIAKLKLDLRSALLDIDRIKNNISLNIAAAYLQVILSEELVQLSQNQLNLTKQQVDRTQKLVDAGNLSLTNLLEIQSQAAQEEVNLVNAQNQLDINYLTLKQLMELTAGTPFKILRPTNLPLDLAYPLSTPEALYETSQRLPEIKTAEIKVESAAKGTKIAQSGYYPSLSLSAQYGSNFFSPKDIVIGYDITTNDPIFGKQSISDQLNKNQSTNLSLNLRIPIFDNFRTKYSVSNARIGEKMAELNLQQSKNTLYKEISQAHADGAASLKKYFATEKAYTSMRETFNSVEKKYNVGSANSLDYNTAKNNLTKAESEYLQAKYQFIFRTKILDFYKGLPIKL